MKNNAQKNERKNKKWLAGCSIGFDFEFEQEEKPTGLDVHARLHEELREILAEGGLDFESMNLQYIEEVER